MTRLRQGYAVASGLGRRVKKVITHSGDWDGTIHYYWDGQRMVQLDDGSDQCSGKTGTSLTRAKRRRAYTRFSFRKGVA